MSRIVLRTVFAFLCLAGVIVFSFSCVCSPSECEEISEDDCPAGGGTVWDPCKCCRVCARTEGEPCGGPHGFHGTCAKDLDCVVSSHASGKPVLAANSEGVCTRHPGSRVNCESPSHAFGCNIINNRCLCERVYFCTEDSPFMFATAEECEVNLMVMLQHELRDVKVPDFSPYALARANDSSGLNERYLECHGSGITGNPSIMCGNFSGREQRLSTSSPNTVASNNFRELRDAGDDKNSNQIPR